MVVASTSRKGIRKHKCSYPDYNPTYEATELVLHKPAMLYILTAAQAIGRDPTAVLGSC